MKKKFTVVIGIIAVIFMIFAAAKFTKTETRQVGTETVAATENAEVKEENPEEETVKIPKEDAKEKPVEVRDSEKPLEESIEENEPVVLPKETNPVLEAKPLPMPKTEVQPVVEENKVTDESSCVEPVPESEPEDDDEDYDEDEDSDEEENFEKNEDSEKDVTPDEPELPIEIIPDPEPGPKPDPEPDSEPGEQTPTDSISDADLDDAHLIACVVSAAAGYESYELQWAIADLILNNVEDGNFGSTVWDVIHRPGFPVMDGLTELYQHYVEDGPLDISLASAYDALGNRGASHGYLFFATNSFYESNPEWFENTYGKEIGGYWFYNYIW